MNARQAARRQALIRDTLAGLLEIFTTNLHQEMNPEQESEMIKLLDLGEKWCRNQP